MQFVEHETLSKARVRDNLIDEVDEQDVGDAAGGCTRAELAGTSNELDVLCEGIDERQGKTDDVGKG